MLLHENHDESLDDNKNWKKTFQITDTVEPRFLDNAINGYPPLMDNKLRS